MKGFFGCGDCGKSRFEGREKFDWVLLKFSGDVK